METFIGTLTQVKNVKQGDFVRFKPTLTAPVWIRQHYDRMSKTYSFCKFDDANHELFCKGSRKCYIDFDF